jgi:citrate lyase subunit gamma (acyl carrier protein)
MSIVKKAQAGTMQSSDLMVFVEPADTLSLEIESTVKKQFEHLIRAKVEQILAACGVTKGSIRISDRGALNYAIEARVRAALARGQEILGAY